MPRLRSQTQILAVLEHPLKLVVLNGWIQGISLTEAALEKFIHEQNMILFKKRLAEAHNVSTHQLLLKLLADEEAKGTKLPSKLLGG